MPRRKAVCAYLASPVTENAARLHGAGQLQLRRNDAVDSLTARSKNNLSTFHQAVGNATQIITARLESGATHKVAE